MKAREGEVDAAFAEALAAGESVPRLREFIARRGADTVLLTSVLRRAVPARLLELVASTPPFSEDQRLMAAVVLSPRAPRPLGLRLVGGLFWHDLAEVAATPRISMAVRARAEALLVDQLPGFRLGERITLARMATAGVLARVLEDPERKVIDAALINGRLREEDLLAAVRRDAAPVALLEAVAASHRWRDRYALRLALVLQPRTPLALALGQITSLLPSDLERVAATASLVPLVQVVARRAAQDVEGHNPRVIRKIL